MDSCDDDVMQWIESGAYDAAIARAIKEDLAKGDDITSRAMVSKKVKARAVIVPRCPGCLAGLRLLPQIAEHFGSREHRLAVDDVEPDGRNVAAGAAVARLSGRLRDILTMERTALNFICHLSGIATLTSQYVERIKGTKAKIYDTRKTLPGLRMLQKYAVRCGRGHTHRLGLFDAMLIKDNHIAGIATPELADRLAGAIDKARKRNKTIKFVEVECDTLAQLEAVLSVPVDLALLDNMSDDQLRQSVAMRDQRAPTVELEASGGVNLDTVQRIAETGVDRISVGALTHSAPALDIGLDVVRQ